MTCSTPHFTIHDGLFDHSHKAARGMVETRETGLFTVRGDLTWKSADWPTPLQKGIISRRDDNWIAIRQSNKCIVEIVQALIRASQSYTVARLERDTASVLPMTMRFLVPL